MSSQNPRTSPFTNVVTKSYGFRSPTGSIGTFYVAGFYEAPAADANLNQGAATVNEGTANIAYGAHAFLVAGGPGAVDAGSCSIVVSGTSITDAGVRTGADSETIVSDITAMALNDYYETTKKWIGQITYTLTPAGAAVYNADFNYGLSKYDDIGNTDFTITDFEAVGRAGANDNSFQVLMLHHTNTGWTYNAAAFIPGDGSIITLIGDYGAEDQLSNGEYFAWKRSNLSTAINGSGSEGFIIKIVTGANNAVESMNLHVTARV